MNKNILTKFKYPWLELDSFSKSPVHALTILLDHPDTIQYILLILHNAIALPHMTFLEVGSISTSCIYFKKTLVGYAREQQVYHIIRCIVNKVERQQK